jgi:hypothetical protein
MLLVALKSRWTMYSNCYPIGVRSWSPAPVPYFHDELLKKRV